MFSETEARLARPTFKALVCLAGKKGFEWEPEVGDWCIVKILDHHAGIISKYDKKTETVRFCIPFDPYNCKDAKCSSAYQILECPVKDIVPIFHWEVLKEILYSFGYRVLVRFESKCGGYFQVVICDFAGRVSSYGIGETIQEAVMRAIIELQERSKKIDVEEGGFFREHHQHFKCCAICDNKIRLTSPSYAFNKEEICPECKEKLAEMKIKVRSVKELIDWIEKNEAEHVAWTLSDLGYRFCFYFNDVDHAVIKKIGKIINIGDDRRLIFVTD